MTRAAISSANAAITIRNWPELRANSACRRSNCRLWARAVPVATRRPGTAAASPATSRVVTSASTGSPSWAAAEDEKKRACSNCIPGRVTTPTRVYERTPELSCTRTRSPTVRAAAAATGSSTTIWSSPCGWAPTVSRAPSARAVDHGWPQERVVASPTIESWAIRYAGNGRSSDTPVTPGAFEIAATWSSVSRGSDGRFTGAPAAGVTWDGGATTASTAPKRQPVTATGSCSAPVTNTEAVTSAAPTSTDSSTAISETHRSRNPRIAKPIMASAQARP